MDDKVKGSVKQMAGKVTGNKELEAEGKLDEMRGNIKDRIEDAKDAATDKVNDALDGVNEKTDPDDETQPHHEDRAA